MKIIYNKYIPFGGFTALTIFVWLFVKLPNLLTDRVRNHEKIHMRQQLEIAVACVACNAALIALTDASWWWMLASIPAPFIIYGLSVGIECLLPPYDQAYKNSCFESEAIYNEHDTDYTRQWWLHLFAWLRYISNRKYPYIPYKNRPPIK